MSVLYCMQDRVSKKYGSCFESDSDLTLRRDFIHQFVSRKDIPDYCIFDTTIIRLATIDYSGPFPLIVPDPVPSVIIRGDDNEFKEIREKLMS